MIEFDPAKDAANLAKHGVSLARAEELEIVAYVEDRRRDYGEVRYRAFGYLDGQAYCLAFVDRDGRVRAISLRRAAPRRCNAMPPKVDLTDPDNPEWTEEDFARAQPASSLPDHVLAAFPRIAARVRGPQQAATKTPVSIRLSRSVVEHFKAGGPGWQSRIDAVLKAAIERKQA